MELRDPIRWLLALVVALAAVASLPLTPAQSEERKAATWPSFQNGGQIQVTSGRLPLRWSPDENIAWQAAIEGYGQSSPVVRDNLIVVTSTSGPNKEKFHLAAFDLTSGEKQWQKDFANPSPEKNTNYVSRAAPTPVADAQGVVALFEGGLCVAFGYDGDVRWQRDLVKDYGAITARHGLGSSLEQDADHVFVWIEREEDPYLVALDKKGGKTVWKAPGLGATSWSSPRLIPTADGPQLICSASGKLAGFDPGSGKRLWTFEEISNNTTCTPFPVGEGSFLIGASDGRGASSGGGAKYNGVIQITKTAGEYSADFLWQAAKASSSFGNPVVAGDNACIVNRSGVLFQLDVKTGEQRSTTRLQSGGIWAAPLVVGDHLYLFGYKGVTSVISLDDNKEVAANRVWKEEAKAEATEGAPGASGGGVLYAAIAAPPYLILRRGDRIYAVKAPSE